VLLNLQELKEKHLETYQAVLDEGRAEGVAQGIAQGVAEERKRIKQIAECTLPGLEDLSLKAMFETGIPANEYAYGIAKVWKGGGILAVEYANDFIESMKAQGVEIPRGIQTDMVETIEDPSASATPGGD